MGLRVRDEATLQRFVAAARGAWRGGHWIEDIAHGPAYRCRTPDGHAVELYWATRRFTATPDVSTAFKNQPQRYVPRGIAPRRLDHINILARDVSSTRRFFHELLGLRLTEQIIFDDGVEMGAWLAATNKSYDVAITRDRSGASGRLHHFTYMMDSREDVLRAADILRDAVVPIETGPHKHRIGQTFFLYCFEPGGNRFEIGAGGYLIFDPDWKPVIWTQAERAKGQAWGLQTVRRFTPTVHLRCRRPTVLSDPWSAGAAPEPGCPRTCTIVQSKCMMHAARRGRRDLAELRPYSTSRSAGFGKWLVGTKLLLLLGALALATAAVGIHAAFAHSVAERRHEMAIRLAVGASRRRVLLMMLREGAAVAVTGVLSGAIVAVLTGRVLQPRLVGLSSADPVVIGMAGTVVLMVAILATWVPALIASRTDPNALLRAE